MSSLKLHKLRSNWKTPQKTRIAFHLPEHRSNVQLLLFISALRLVFIGVSKCQTVIFNECLKVLPIYRRSALLMAVECQAPAAWTRAGGSEQALGICPPMPGSREVLDPVCLLPFGMKHILFLTYSLA